MAFLPLLTKLGGRAEAAVAPKVLNKSPKLNLAWKVYVFDLIARIRRAVCNGYKLTFLFSAEGFRFCLLENGL